MHSAPYPIHANSSSILKQVHLDTGISNEAMANGTISVDRDEAIVTLQNHGFGDSFLFSEVLGYLSDNEVSS